MRINKYSFAGLSILESGKFISELFQNDCSACLNNFDIIYNQTFITRFNFDKQNVFWLSNKTYGYIDEIDGQVLNPNLFKDGFNKTYILLSKCPSGCNVSWVLHADKNKETNTMFISMFECHGYKITGHAQYFVEDIDGNPSTYIEGDRFLLDEDGHFKQDLVEGNLMRLAQISSRLLIFLNFVDVETKIIGSSGKSLYIENEKVKNDTNFNIKVLDKTWYTTVINSEGFPVRGHLRLQPVGEGRKDRKLIYIEPFEKNGYKREAGILKSKGLV